ncbi:ABC transporter ATP-binding protein [Gracilibacillus caseinilyticus]|uniref:ABC transporter ATP-binding protein n=1 Tax=Gracilibacillus caseinilyticus TaxID=2932256 RepID=A0ABY4ET84_9BACI|nr:ABC transporter ATP-binding protein [Gracilibacillus caseinilyticus]UOQ47281.1 ABC transporter ATP-binding protein [Gracilibacillus caseinilyticus]
MFVIRNLVYKNILRIEHLEIESGNIYCLFGTSGSGKTTLLKMFNGMLTPDEGEIHFKKSSIQELDAVELRQKVVMLGQDPIVFEGTIRDNLLIGLRFSEQDKEPSDNELTDLLQKLQLSKDLDEDAANLSGGEKQRIAFGRVLVMEPDVFLLDEPTSALDDDTETMVMDYFTKRIKEFNKTVIMVTHSKDTAETYSDQLIYMSELLKDKEVRS